MHLTRPHRHSPKKQQISPGDLPSGNRKNLSGWKSLGEAWQFWRVPWDARLHSWWQLPRSASQTQSEAPWLQRSQETLRKALSPQLTVKGAEGGTTHKCHSPLYRDAVSQFVFNLILPAYQNISYPRSTRDFMKVLFFFFNQKCTN